MPKLPSPCIDVYKHCRGGHCIAFSMTKVQKKMGKALDRPDPRAEFVARIWRQQQQLGGFGHWLGAYQQMCRRKGVRWEPLETATAAE